MTRASVAHRAHRLEYEARVNRVIDHVYGHLADELSLPALARVAAFSPFHFHRVFTAIAGETLFAFIQRVRIEYAAAALRDRPGASVLEVALDHGFASAATFARAFRAHFGMSATGWRAGGAERWRARTRRQGKGGKQVRKAGKASSRAARHTPRMTVTIRTFPAQHVAYMRYVGPFGPHGIPDLWARFRRWLAARDLHPELALGIAHDDPSITPPDRCRYDACAPVPRDFRPDRAVNVTDIAGGAYAVAGFTGTADDIVAAWEHVFGAWLPQSGFQPDDRPCFELYRGDPTVEPKTRTFRCELCLPVRPL
ncbi:MAG: AraC family transcriptional regulator [Candidatus Rokubacteria bacterium]|nr:AraC family transcriptional regulator [Candidatus Rokubacteria bacterium]